MYEYELVCYINTSKRSRNPSFQRVYLENKRSSFKNKTSNQNYPHKNQNLSGNHVDKIENDL